MCQTKTANDDSLVPYTQSTESLPAGSPRCSAVIFERESGNSTTTAATASRIIIDDRFISVLSHQPLRTTREKGKKARMMAGRREGSLMRDKTQSFRGSRIVTAIVMGILLGCVFAFLFPHGFLSSYPPIQNRRFGKSDLQVRISLP